MVRSVGGPRIQNLQAKTEAEQPARLPDAITPKPFLLSQSGKAMPAGDWPAKPFLPPELAGQIEKLEVVAMDPAGVHRKNEFSIDDKGTLESTAYANPLGHNPYQLTLVAKDGTRYTADVDISPSKLKVSHSGYETLSGLRFEKEVPPPPAEIELGSFLLSQSGNVVPEGSWPQHTPIVPPGMEGFFEKMEVMALDPGGVHAKNEFHLDDKGSVESTAYSRPLGHNPYQVTLLGKDGSRYSGTVDISPKKIKVSHSGYETISGLKLTRERAPVAADDEALQGVAGDFARTGGANKEAPSFSGSPLGLYWANKK